MKYAEPGSLEKDYSKVSKKIERFISDYLVTNNTKGFVIGLSGGLDSAAALQLCVNSVGAKRVFGLILPSLFTPENDILDAANHAAGLGVECKTIRIDPLVKSYSNLLPEASDKIKGNLMARIRMSIMYYYAASRDFLVIGTSDKSESLIGFYTKFGDGAADILPLANLYKTDLRSLARYLEIPREIVAKRSSPRLWADHLAEQEIGMDFETIDKILHYLVDRKIKPKDTARILRISPAKVKRVESMVNASAHKRNMPPSAPIT